MDGDRENEDEVLLLRLRFMSTEGERDGDIDGRLSLLLPLRTLCRGGVTDLEKLRPRGE